MFLDFKRIIKAGFTNFSRNSFVSVVSVMVMTITLSVIVGVILLQGVLQSSLASISQKVDVTAYFVPGASETRIAQVKEKIDSLPEVKETTYVSAETALDVFIERHKNDFLTLQALNELDTNPLGASLNIRTQETSQYQAVAVLLSSEDGSVGGEFADAIDKVNYFQNKEVIDRLNSIIDKSHELGLVMTIILMIISISVTFNTIRLTIYIARDEIRVMKLVGASLQYIRGPFVVEGILYGIVATIITTVLFLPITYWLGDTMSTFLGVDLYAYYMSNIFQIIGIQFTSGVILGTLSSLFAIGRYLKK
ncbi:MAG: cell division transport system permease protein [Flavobacteriaceae bacterium]|jgi:cell division transport system permease protein